MISRMGCQKAKTRARYRTIIAIFKPTTWTTDGHIFSTLCHYLSQCDVESDEAHFNEEMHHTTMHLAAAIDARLLSTTSTSWSSLSWTLLAWLIDYHDHHYHKYHDHHITSPSFWCIILVSDLLLVKVAEVGRLSANAKNAFNSFVKCIIANLQQKRCFCVYYQNWIKKRSFCA